MAQAVSQSRRLAVSQATLPKQITVQDQHPLVATSFGLPQSCVRAGHWSGTSDSDPHARLFLCCSEVGTQLQPRRLAVRKKKSHLDRSVQPVHSQPVHSRARKKVPKLSHPHTFSTGQPTPPFSPTTPFTFRHPPVHPLVPFASTLILTLTSPHHPHHPHSPSHPHPHLALILTSSSRILLVVASSSPITTVLPVLVGPSACIARRSFTWTFLFRSEASSPCQHRIRCPRSSKHVHPSSTTRLQKSAYSRRTNPPPLKSTDSADDI
ncbi:hypothetical protein BJ875DRAFT_262203 [Amylocarpus encephaloides]|uniref:Uncharacterized protein n=1 Tax=Amylocarpus encephaloides TaxID=45428 RepID=A0A9P8C9N7_9HELO|nr:hypothetical protein BJ875DRAFT_262203 [Amylocarpus encephaloides]